MTIKSIITSAVLLGSTSAAFARPAPVPDDCDQTTTSTIVQPAAWQPGYTNPGYSHPVVLGGGRHKFDEGRKFITVGAQQGRFRALKINATVGGVFIKQVYVQFENGQEQVIRNIDARLTGNQGITLDLDGGARAIRRVVVYGNDVRLGRGSYLRRNSTFTVTAV